MDVGPPLHHILRKFQSAVSTILYEQFAVKGLQRFQVCFPRAFIQETKNVPVPQMRSAHHFVTRTSSELQKQIRHGPVLFFEGMYQGGIEEEEHLAGRIALPFSVQTD
jgi:hypothetical protein